MPGGSGNGQAIWSSGGRERAQKGDAGLYPWSSGVSRARDASERGVLAGDADNSALYGEAGGRLAERTHGLGVVDVRTTRELGSVVAHLLGDRSQPVGRVEQVERHREQTRAESAEAQLRTFERSERASRVEQLLHALILREWMSVLTDAERRERPLGGLRWREGLALQPEGQPARRPTAALLGATGPHHRVHGGRRPR